MNQTSTSEKLQKRLNIINLKQDLEAKYKTGKLHKIQNQDNQNSLYFQGDFYQQINPNYFFAVIIGALMLFIASRLLYEK